VCKKHNISVKKPKSPPQISSQIISPLPEGMFIKTGNRCPNGSKTHKYKDKTVCKKNK
jgi:hypothetical protein